MAFDKATLNVPYLCGLLGDRGWELVTVETRLQPGAMGPVSQNVMYFKREAPDTPTG